MKPYKSNKEAREAFRMFLIAGTHGCVIQEGAGELGWPCGTCTIAFLEKLGLDPKDPQYSQHNKKVDRMNEVWRAILQIREAE